MPMFTPAQTRRAMLARMVSLAGGTVLASQLPSAIAKAGPATYQPRVVVQFYVWLQRFASLKKTAAEGMEEALTAIHRAGYRRVELVSGLFHPDLRAKTLSLLKREQLEIPTLYAGSALHKTAIGEESIAAIVQLARELKSAGLEWIVTNPNPKPGGEQKTDAELDLQAHNLNRLGAELQQSRVRLMVHHHTPELMNNAREWRFQLRHTDPRLVSCCVDVNWAFRGGQPPLAFVREAGDRLVSVHLRNERNGVWMEDFGPGDIDYAPIADYLKKIAYRGYLVIELAYEKATDIRRSLEEDLRLSRFYAELVFGVKAG